MAQLIMGIPVVVICNRPGLIRGGIANPAVASYEAAAFTRDQLAELVAEPAITVVVGEVLTAGRIDELVAAVRGEVFDGALLGVETPDLGDDATAMAEEFGGSGSGSGGAGGAYHGPVVIPPGAFTMAIGESAADADVSATDKPRRRGKAAS